MMGIKDTIKIITMVALLMSVIVGFGWLEDEAAKEQGYPRALTITEECKHDAKQAGYNFIKYERAGGGWFSAPDKNCWVRNDNGTVFQLW